VTPGIHAADTPQSDTTPPSTVSSCCWNLMLMLMVMLMLMLMVGADRWSARSGPARNASTHGVDLLPAQ